MPIYEVTDPKTGVTLELEGDSPPTEQELEQLFSQYSVKEQKTFPQKLAGAGEALATIGSGMIAEPVAGLAGIGSALFGGDGGKTVEDVKSAMTYAPRTQAGGEYLQNIGNAPVIKQIGETMTAASKGAGDLAYDLTGSPVVAAGAAAIPEGIASLIGLKAPGATGRVAARQSDNLAKSAAGMLTPEAEAGSVAAALKTGKTANIADVAQPDPAFFGAMKKLGMTEEPLPSFSSQNPEYRGVEMGLSAIPGSPIAARELAFTKELAQKADGIISEFGGSLDKPELSNQFRSKMTSTIGDMEKQASDAYSLIAERLDKRAPANPEKTLGFINSEVDDLALKIDDPDVPSVISTAMKSLSPRQVVDGDQIKMVPPTYANVDKLRRQVGAALYKKEGTFKDAESGLLSKLYSNLTDDLDKMAESQGLVDEVKAAKSIVSQRKRIEEKYQNLLGNDLQKDLLPAVSSALKGLKTGKIEDYRRTMNNLPDKETRQAALVSSLNDVFRGTAQGKDRLDATQYTKWHADTLRNPSIRKELAKDLPDGALEKLDALNLISNGISTALKDKKPTGVVNAMFDEKSGILRNLAGKAAGTAANVATKGLAGGIVQDIISASTNQAKAAGNLLSDPALIEAIRKGVEAGTVSGSAKAARIADANKKLMRSERYKKWAETLSDSDKAKLSSVGAVNFILEASEEKQ